MQQRNNNNNKSYTIFLYYMLSPVLFNLGCFYYFDGSYFLKYIFLYKCIKLIFLKFIFDTNKIKRMKNIYKNKFKTKNNFVFKKTQFRNKYRWILSRLMRRKVV